MNEKEISEIRRRYRLEKSNISSVIGCYVNEKGEIISEFNQSLALMPEKEAEHFLSILKKTLSGTINKNLIDIEFSTQQAANSEEHSLLMALKNSALKDKEAVQKLFKNIIEANPLEGNYVILLSHEAYDVPYRSSDGAKQNDASAEVFSYILCSICPMALSKPALSYYISENEFRSRKIDRVVAAPELGFMFPSFEDNSANIYNSLYYSRDSAKIYEEFVNKIFNTVVPMPATQQKETFTAVLSEALAADCKFEIIHAVHQDLQAMIEEHKVNKEEIPLKISKNAVKQILKANGVEEAHLTHFDEQFCKEFGEETALSPKNIVDEKQVRVTTPFVKINVSAGGDGLVETRIINDAKYIMVRAEDGVELNGVPVNIS